MRTLLFYSAGAYLVWCAITGKSKLIESLLDYPELAAMSPWQRLAYYDTVKKPATVNEITEQYVQGDIDYDAFCIAIDEAIRREFDAA